MARSALRRLLGLTWQEWRVLTRTTATLAFTRLALKVLPFARVRRLVTQRPGSTVHPWISIEKVRWGISNAQRLIPDATCLPQALTAEALLTRGGIPVTLRIGVMKDSGGKLAAHAWAECGRIIVVGNLNEQMRDYTLLPPLPGAWSDAEARTVESR